MSSKPDFEQWAKELVIMADKGLRNNIESALESAYNMGVEGRASSEVVNEENTDAVKEVIANLKREFPNGWREE